MFCVSIFLYRTFVLPVLYFAARCKGVKFLDVFAATSAPLSNNIEATWGKGESLWVKM